MARPSSFRGLRPLQVGLRQRATLANRGTLLLHVGHYRDGILCESQFSCFRDRNSEIGDGGVNLWQNAWHLGGTQSHIEY